MLACADGTLDKIDLQFEDNAAVCVMLASDGYPVSYKKGFEIKDLKTSRIRMDTMYSIQVLNLLRKKMEVKWLLQMEEESWV